MTAQRTRRVSMSAVAEETGLSVAAVSMALSDSTQISADTKQRVRTACRRLGYQYRPQRRRAGRRGAAHYGLMVFGQSLTDEVVMAFVHDIAAQAGEYGMRLELGALPDTSDDEECARRLAEYCRGLDGVIVRGTFGAAVRRQVLDAGIPHVVQGSMLADWPAWESPPHLRHVTPDCIAMGRVATRWLINKGRHRIALVCTAMPPGMYVAGWADGYRLAHLDAGIPLDAALVRIAGRDPSGVQDALRSLASLKRPPDACIVPDARATHAVLAGIAQSGPRLRADAIVLTGHPATLASRGLSRYPLVTEDSAATADAALRLLELAREGRAPAHASITVPFVTRNLT